MVSPFSWCSTDQYEISLKSTGSSSCFVTLLIETSEVPQSDVAPGEPDGAHRPFYPFVRHGYGRLVPTRMGASTHPSMCFSLYGFLWLDGALNEHSRPRWGSRLAALPYEKAQASDVICKRAARPHSRLNTSGCHVWRVHRCRAVHDVWTTAVSVQVMGRHSMQCACARLRQIVRSRRLSSATTMGL